MPINPYAGRYSGTLYADLQHHHVQAALGPVTVSASGALMFDGTPDCGNLSFAGIGSVQGDGTATGQYADSVHGTVTLYLWFTKVGTVKSAAGYWTCVDGVFRGSGTDRTGISLHQ